MVDTANQVNSQVAAKKQQKRPSRKDVIAQNANPTTRLSGVQKTITIPVSFNSDILFQYMELKQGPMLAGYERLAALKRMLGRDPKLMKEVDQWIETNKNIVVAQMAELESQRSALVKGKIFDDVQVNIPTSYATKFEASHPVVHKMVEIIMLIDEQLNLNEQVYFAGQMDDIQYSEMRNQALVAIRGSVDRIYKVTQAGTRSGGRYSAKELMEWMRQGNRLAFTDYPQIAAAIVQQHGEAA